MTKDISREFDSANFNGGFQDFIGYFCDHDIYTYMYYQFLDPVCDFDKALDSDFFDSPDFEGDFLSFAYNYCDYGAYGYEDFYYYDDLYYYYDYDEDYDGLLLTDYLDDFWSCELFISEAESLPWLQLEFSKEIKVSQIMVAVRFDCCNYGFSNITVSVGNKAMVKGKLSRNPVCTKYQGPPHLGANITLSCDETLTGTYVVIQQDNAGQLLKMSVNEVFVCGEYEDGKPLWW